MCRPCDAVARRGRDRTTEIARTSARRQADASFRDLLNERSRAWRATHRPERAAYDRRYAAAHRADRAARQAVRLFRIRGASGSHTPQEWRTKLAEFGGRCAYCGRGDVALTRDHVVPIARGGTNDIRNIVPACMPCNRAKATLTARQFQARRAA